MSSQTPSWHFVAASREAPASRSARDGEVPFIRQRADACSDSQLRSILLHLMRDEMEHAAMLTEWLRRGDVDFAAELRTYLFTAAPIVEIEAAADATNATKAESSPSVEDDRAATIGSLKETHA